jgi:outer membrane protein OmpA-like peptidoglycan-associated protein
MKEIFIRHIALKLIVSFVFLLSFSAYAQKEDKILKKANKAYSNYAYSQAIECLNQVDGYRPEVMRKKAMSYIHLHQTEAAEPILYKLVTSSGFQPEDLYQYAYVLRANEKYRESEEWMKKYGELKKDDTRAQLYLRAKGNFARLKKENKNFKVYNLEMNSTYSDFAPALCGNQVVFASSRPREIDPIRRRWNQSGQPFLDLYIADRAADNRLTNSKPIAGKVNGKYHEGPVTFNEAGDFMIITRNSPAGRNEDGVVRLQLFASHLIDGDWQKPEPLPFNNEAYSVGHASLSKDGKTLYFASNMPGGLGGVDIYKAKVNDDGTYGDPVNLGNRINTEGDEMFPFAHASGELLFFSSNGRVGLGGQDVFLAQLKKDQSVGKVMNLGAPINSSSDDFGLVLSEDQSNGYFSSNRKGGKGSDDVYGFDLAKAFSFGRIIRGTIMDTKGKPLADAEVRLFDLRTGQEEVVHSDEDGFYSFVVEENKSFNLRGQKESYFDANATTSTHITEEFVEVNLKLVKDPGISIYAQITDKFSGKPLAKVKMVMKDLITGENEEVITTASGDYFKPLIGRKLEDKGSYRFVLKRVGYLNKTVDYNAVFKSLGKYEVHKVIDLSMTPAQPGDDMLERLQLNPIHLEKTETDISAEHAVQLDKIVAVLNDNPRLTIQIRVHTDVFGSAQTNQRITEKQAQVIAAYLAERITNPERVTSKGLGESQPTMVDATADGGHKEEVLTEAFINSFKSNDNNEAYEKYVKLSRRVEFVILKM